ncbi:hypothetical protein C8J57DRAFT_1259106 [Mycena rebaudengoi]|nr:hypothetical protein C8J57DRAFT_1259106 [Mycena rebaudengoi]
MEKYTIEQVDVADEESDWEEPPIWKVPNSTVPPSAKMFPHRVVGAGADVRLGATPTEIDPPPKELEAIVMHLKWNPNPGDLALGPPMIREGHKMTLAQLTDQGTVIKGYTKLRIFMLSTEGEMVESEVEAYVVKGMLVPLLLG